MPDCRSIGVFDSGLGGLSVVKELICALPGEDIIYFGDTGRVPYGTRSFETIEKYARQDEAFLLSQNVKLIIAACGTVSAVAPHTGRELPVPFIEVVNPAAAAAVKATKSGRIGVIGTTATIKSGSYTKCMKSLNSQIEVIANDCPIFVPLVEAGWIERDNCVTIETAKRYLKPMIDGNVDTLILGCTHYPVLKDIIADIMGDNVVLINTGEQAAITAAQYLFDHDMLGNKSDVGQKHFFVSDRTDSFSHTASILLGSDITGSVERVDIDRIGG
ncbi:MAG: glutamate racemase [Oscillospiraceae bacterium]|nr:glutamate racemase [Oscillospiraceae bacterium]